MMEQGIYETLITELISRKLNSIDKNAYYIKETTLDKEEASNVLSQHLSKTLQYAFSLLKGDNSLQLQI